MDDLAADLIALLDEIGSERISLAGVSIGGMASLAVAARAPERVERLVVIGSSARLGPVRAWVERSRTALLDGLAPIAEVVTPRWVSGTFAASHPEAMSRYREMFSAADPAGYAGCCIAIAGMDLTDELARIAAPTLVVVGSDDPATPPEHSRAIAATVPRARLVTLDGGAHLPSLERPDEIVSLMVEHLS
jgi:3-oxoadipate enol-lactonase